MFTLVGALVHVHDNSCASCSQFDLFCEMRLLAFKVFPENFFLSDC